METVLDRSCTIHIGEGSLHLADDVPIRSRCILLCERHAAGLILPPLREVCPRLDDCRLYYLDATEPDKQIETLIPLWEAWTKDGVDRRTTVILLGGGVLCDMGGFAASVYKRGIPFASIPTTLLAMADASTGGKTGVDLKEIKNIIGCFHRPETVWIDPVFLQTLPQREFLSGVAEILKMQMIGNGHFDIRGAEACFDSRNFPLPFLHFAVAEKARITDLDFQEEHIRKTLNFGHTFGHAFEALALKRNRPVTHGEAVAHGMLCELFLSQSLTGFDPGQFKKTVKMLQKHYGIFPYSSEDIPLLLQYMRNDKKNRDGKIYPILLPAFGHAVYHREVPQELLEKALEAYPFSNL